MSDEQLEKAATLIRLWTSKIQSGRLTESSKQYFQGKIDATWQFMDSILTDDEIQKVEALTGEKR